MLSSIILMLLWVIVVPGLLYKKSTEVSVWPSLAEVEELAKAKPPLHSQPSLPYIANRKLLKNLIQGIRYSKCVKVIVGPRDSGKTSGINLVTEAWQQSGHTVVNINLKGVSNKASWEEVMLKATKDIYKVMSTLDYSKYWCILREVKSNCGRSMSEWTGAMIWDIIQNLSSRGSIIALLGTTLPVVIRIIQAIVPQKYLAYLKLPQQTVFYLSIVCAAAFSIMIGLNFRYLMYELIAPGIIHGNWDTFQCSLNAIDHCEPERKPVVVIHEISNLDDDAKKECFAAVEKMKENIMHFPMILETAYFSWLDASSVCKSRLSFCPYYVEEMSYSEIAAEVVDTHKLWSTEEFKKIHDAIGGHIGSYSRFYMYQTYYNMSIDDSLAGMKREAVAHISNCLNKVGNASDAISVLSDLKTANYSLSVLIVTDTVNTLTNCNVLFYSPFEMVVFPQNKLLETAISVVLENYKEK